MRLIYYTNISQLTNTHNLFNSPKRPSKYIIYKTMQNVDYFSADACLLVHDVTDPRSFENLHTWKSEFMQTTGGEQSFPFIVLGNKVDREEERRVQRSKAEQWCRMSSAAPLSHYETSAKNAVNVDNAFLDAAVKALKHEEVRSRESNLFVPPQTVDLNRYRRQESSMSNNTCC